MKTLILSIAFTIVSTLGFSQDIKGNTITLTIENFLSNDGKAVVALHTEDTFMKGPGVLNQEGEIVDGTATFTFENVEAGEYAFMVLHDTNENGRMDFEDNGMPKESYGTSNNVRSFGPPVYTDAKFNLKNKDLELSIRL